MKSSNMTKFKIVCIVLLLVVLAIILVPMIAVGVVGVKTEKMLDDISNLSSDPKYSESVGVLGVPLVKQEVSCGYAVIEMIASWLGMDVTEESLMEEYGKVVTGEGKNFAKEMNKRFTSYTTTMYKYLNSTDLIDKAYNSLKAGLPVPFEWAAKYEDKWTLHYSLLVGMDIKADKCTILNPYGYEEELSLQDFISRTSFEAYKPMGAMTTLGFAFGIFEKNTIFVMSAK